MDSRRKLGSTRANAMIALLVLLGLLNSACASLSFTVGDSSGWRELSNGSTPYDQQFQNITLVEGDSLIFAIGYSNHTVCRVTAEQLANCDGTDPTGPCLAPGTSNNVPVSYSFNLTLNTPGYWGFICNIGNHCSQGGMHLAVNVTAAPSTAPTIAPVQPDVATPDKSGAHSLVSAPLAVLLAFTTAFLAILIV